MFELILILFLCSLVANVSLALLLHAEYEEHKKTKKVLQYYKDLYYNDLEYKIQESKNNNT